MSIFRSSFLPTAMISTSIALMLVVPRPARAQVPQKVAFEDVTSVYHTKNAGKDVYAFIAPEPKSGIVGGNSVAIIGSDAVLVVDSGHFPTLTHRMIADIKAKTTEPVRYLVVTHWHDDHNSGNSVYAAAFPGLAIIATPFTRDAMNAYNAKLIQVELTKYPQFLALAQKSLQTGKRPDGKPLTEANKVFFTNLAEAITKDTPQLKEQRYLGPNMTFTDQLNIDLGGREVKLFWFGNANTGGDAVAYVPDQKVLITGDILVWPVPYAANSYIGSWVKVLDKLLTMDVSAIVPGHGPVMHDKTYLKTVRQLLADLNDQVKQGIAQGLSLEQVKNKVTMQSYKDELTQGIPERVYAWDNYFMPAVESAWKEQKDIPIDENPFPSSTKK